MRAEAEAHPRKEGMELRTHVQSQGDTTTAQEWQGEEDVELSSLLGMMRLVERQRKEAAQHCQRFMHLLEASVAETGVEAPLGKPDKVFRPSQCDSQASFISAYLAAEDAEGSWADDEDQLWRSDARRRPRLEPPRRRGLSKSMSLDDEEGELWASVLQPSGVEALRRRRSGEGAVRSRSASLELDRDAVGMPSSNQRKKPKEHRERRVLCQCTGSGDPHLPDASCAPKACSTFRRSSCSRESQSSPKEPLRRVHCQCSLLQTDKPPGSCHRRGCIRNVHQSCLAELPAAPYSC